MQAPAWVQVCEARGKLQHIHCIVCTYSEAAATVELCVQRLLDAALPVYADLTVYVADDGHAKPEGPRKRAFVERMRAEGALSSPHRADCEHQSAVRRSRAQVPADTTTCCVQAAAWCTLATACGARGS